jgi:hypothetical protein
MKSRITAAAAVAALAVTGVAGAVTAGADVPPPPAPATGGYEVWSIDQTDTRAGFGGLLSIHRGADLETDPALAEPEVIDLGGRASELCRERTGADLVRPHMLVFDGGDDDGTGRNRYAAIASVVSGHVLILRADTREPIECLRTSAGELGRRQAHAMWPTPDRRHLIVANQNGKLLERVATDWANERFTLEPTATLNLHEGTTPSGAPRQSAELRPDNAPICPRTTNDGRLTFVSLRGGGAFVVDHTTTPMRIVAEYDKTTVGDNGCGQVQADDKMYVNAGAGAPGRPDAWEVYAFDLRAFGTTPSTVPNRPAPVVVERREGDVDAHAVALTKNEKFLLAGDRTQNDVTVIDTRDSRVLGRWSLAGPISADPAPDLFDLAPDEKRVFASLRGPSPLSGGHDAVGSTPGVGVIALEEGGRSGRLVGLAPARRADGRLPDPHAIRVRTLDR